jgi:hypothetical protein
VLVVHTCNPSYSGGSNQEDCGLKTAWGNSSRDLISKKKNPSQKRTDRVAQGEGPDFKLQYQKQTNKQTKTCGLLCNSSEIKKNKN